MPLDPRGLNCRMVGSGVIKAFLFGLGLGIGLGILFAPVSGQETRERISEGRERVDRGNKALRREGGPRPTGTEAPAV